MFEAATAEEVIDALEGRYGPEAEATAVWEAIDGDLGEDLREHVLMAAVQGAHGEGFRGEAVEIANELGLVERWQQEAQAEPEADPEYQQQILDAQVEEAQNRMAAIVDAEVQRLEQKIGRPLTAGQYDEVVRSIPESAFDGAPFPDLVKEWEPKFQAELDSDETRLDRMAERARELVEDRETEETPPDRTRFEQRLYGDDPVPPDDSEDGRLERMVLAGWSAQASDEEIDQVQAEHADLAADAGGGPEAEQGA